MALLKRLLISFSGGLLLLCIWGVVIVATSQDFAHEGPNSVWFSPIEKWSQLLIDLGWTSRVSSFSPILMYPIQIAAIFGPFVLVFSAVAYLAANLMRKEMVARKLS
jgi:hypothetical protein